MTSINGIEAEIKISAYEEKNFTITLVDKEVERE